MKRILIVVIIAAMISTKALAIESLGAETLIISAHRLF